MSSATPLGKEDGIYTQTHTKKDTHIYIWPPPHWARRTVAQTHTKIDTHIHTWHHALRIHTGRVRVLVLLCVCVSVSGVLFFIGVCVCDRLIFLHG